MRTRWVVLGVLAVALLLAGVVSFAASTAPDGLNRVAQDTGFAHTATQREPAAAVVPAWVARVGGVLLVLGLGSGVAWAVRRRRGADD